MTFGVKLSYVLGAYSINKRNHHDMSTRILRTMFDILTNTAIIPKMMRTMMLFWNIAYVLKRNIPGKFVGFIQFLVRYERMNCTSFHLQFIATPAKTSDTPLAWSITEHLRNTSQ